MKRKRMTGNNANNTVKLIHGDCLKEMIRISDKSIDMILADPPYETTTCKWDFIIPLEPMWKQLKRIIKSNGAIVLTASQPFTTTLISSNMEIFKYCWVWEKSHPSGIALVNKRVMKYHEDIAIFYTKQPTYNPIKWEGAVSHSVGNQLGKKTNSKSNPNMKQITVNYPKEKHPKSIIKVANPRIKGQHPTQKPVALMEYLIKTYTNEGEIVLDFCMGSGTTGCACKNLNRNFIGIENDNKYFPIAKQRIENWQKGFGILEPKRQELKGTKLKGFDIQ